MRDYKLGMLELPWRALWMVPWAIVRIGFGLIFERR